MIVDNKLILAMVVLLCSAPILVSAQDPTAELWPVSSPDCGIIAYAPQQTTLSDTVPPEYTGMPADAKVLFGEFKIGAPELGNTFGYLIVNPIGTEPKLLIDSNKNKNFSDDEISSFVKSGYTMADGMAILDLPGGKKLKSYYKFYRHEISEKTANDPNMAGYLKRYLYSNFHYNLSMFDGVLSIDGKDYKISVSDADGDLNLETEKGLAMLIDLDGNGEFDKKKEKITSDSVFALGESYYVVSGVKEWTITLKPMSLHTSVYSGEDIVKPAITLKFTDFLTEKNIDLKDYRGKYVLIDFWATWCGPCLKEMPNVIKLYNETSRGKFDILGISLDKEGDEEKLRKMLEEKGMPWPQRFVGKYWNDPYVKKFGVGGIPATFLIGPDGQLIEKNIRGEELIDTVKKLISKK